MAETGNIAGEVTLDWADGKYTFRLTVKGAIELEDKCNAPIAVIAQRIQTGGYRVEDVRQTIRLGLIGGGTSPIDAAKLVERYVDNRPLAEGMVMARLVLGGMMYGFEAHPLGKPAAAGTGGPAPNGSTPPPSTQRPPSSEYEDPILLN